VWDFDFEDVLLPPNSMWDPKVQQRVQELVQRTLGFMRRGADFCNEGDSVSERGWLGKVKNGP